MTLNNLVLALSAAEDVTEALEYRGSDADFSVIEPARSALLAALFTARLEKTDSS